jgi:hypothetical protein
MLQKKIIIVATTALLFGLMVLANMGDGAGEKTAGDGAASQPTSLQKDLPSEEKIPSH